MGLHSMETLFLSCEHLEARLPELRLRVLPKLRHVRLDDVLPAELSLPQGCRLDVNGDASVMQTVPLGPCHAHIFSTLTQKCS